ncbi:MAG TPA: hypothetical protein VH684_15560 [Xanthobacteraceae bacterium]
MSELVGHVDGRERPLIRVPIPDQDRSFLALVDTGFNGWLLMEAVDAASLGFVLSELALSVEFAGRGHNHLGVAHGYIVWFGRRHRVEVLVSTARAGRPALPDEPVALLGTRLLRPHQLTVDFGAHTVSIESRE